MKTFAYVGQRIDWLNTTGSAVASGGVVVLVSGASGFIGIAVDAIPVGATGALEVKHAHTLTKHTGEAFTPLQQLFWDATNSRLTGSSTGNSRAGRSDGTYASAATSATALINVP